MEPKTCRPGLMKFIIVVLNGMNHYIKTAFDSSSMARKELDFEKEKLLSSAQNVFGKKVEHYTLHRKQINCYNSRVNNLDEVENWSVRWHKITVD